MRALLLLFFFILPAIAQDKPNIIFILADDLSYKDLSAYGQKKFSTPHLDGLVHNGLRFTNAYSGAAECGPARGSFLTGMHMGHCRIRENRSVRGQEFLKEEDITVAEVLKGAGYKTGFIGKWGVGLPGTEGVPHKQGFDLAYGYYCQARAHGFYPHFLERNGVREWLPENFGFNQKRVGKYNRCSVKDFKGLENIYDENGILVPDGVKDPKHTSYSEDLFQQEAVRFIQENNKNPFFLYYATQLPHGPCISPDISAHKDKDWSLKHKEWAAMVQSLDSGVGKIVGELKKEGIYENTVIFFASDNGYAQWGYFGRGLHEDDPLFQNKGDFPKGKFDGMYTGGMRVPFFVSWEGKVKAGESDHLCTLYDFLATAADLADTPAPQTDGVSILPTMVGDGATQKKHDYLYWEGGGRTQGSQTVHFGEYWAMRKSMNKPIQIYNIVKDPQMKKNLAKEKAELIPKVKEMFSASHVASEWYFNPGDGQAEMNAKKARAREYPKLPHNPASNELLPE